MTVCCMFIILLGCKFLHTAQSQTTCPCKEQLKTLCGSVSVPCPDKSEIQKLNVVLYKDNQKIFVCNSTENCSVTHSSGGVRYVDKDNKFIITEVTGRSLGIYYCEIEKFYPPPYATISTLKIKVLEEGPICKSNQNSTNHNDSPSHGFVWIWIVAVVFLIIYSITVTIIALANWVKLRKTESHSDYMNTKPRALRERRKKKGVQNPVPRYF
ncbi:hypothetical protein INR49_026028 [Caranx melampygus]|nr:hypothetical protein INR49_026028 [Caranx melampygus]